ncbi:uncharacterized protein LOC109706323 [Ananas comosus]|uniref:Uncharacterized protein LOC109706323 n=1 Tax=Ananas comosus TaxID=4615 RepID=A0A6P5EGW0_ANACO|nr:uncharacterized protein LOC109706323 [Ananas comosus]
MAGGGRTEGEPAGGGCGGSVGPGGHAGRQREAAGAVAARHELARLGLGLTGQRRPGGGRRSVGATATSRRRPREGGMADGGRRRRAETVRTQARPEPTPGGCRRQGSGRGPAGTTATAARGSPEAQEGRAVNPEAAAARSHELTQVRLELPAGGRGWPRRRRQRTRTAGAGGDGAGGRVSARE